MKHLLLIASLLAFSPVAVHADEVDEAIAAKKAKASRKKQADDEEIFDRRIKTLIYDADKVYVIRARYGYQSNIEFSRSEEIQTISVGDRSLWQIVPAGHRLFIRPMDENMTTNMTVITNKRSYQFDLKAGEADDTSPDIVYVARFTYPQARPADEISPVLPFGAPTDLAPPATAPVMKTVTGPAVEQMPAPASIPAGEAPSTAPTSPPVAPVTTSGTPARPNFNYTFSGPDALAPLQVFDDGASTYIKYRDMGAALPDVYVITPEGMEKLVTHRVQADAAVVDAVAGEMVLKSPSGKVFIYNEAASRKAP